MIRLVWESSDMALQREAVVVSSWTRPCRLAALINLIRQLIKLQWLSVQWKCRNVAGIKKMLFSYLATSALVFSSAPVTSTSLWLKACIREVVNLPFHIVRYTTAFKYNFMKRIWCRQQWFLTACRRYPTFACNSWTTLWMCITDSSYQRIRQGLTSVSKFCICSQRLPTIFTVNGYKKQCACR